MTTTETRTNGPRSLDWWVRDSKGRLSIAKFPNPALWVWLVGVGMVATGLTLGLEKATLSNVAKGALIVWALDELIRGSSPIRRVLGAVVLGYQVVTLLA